MTPGPPHQMKDVFTDTVDPVGVVDPAGMASHRLRPGDFISDRYEISELLGSGGSANVYAARDHVLDKIIALKLLRPERSTPAALTRLRREAMLAQRVQ